MKIINEDVTTAVEHLRFCLRRIERDLAAGNRGRMLSDLAQLSETANRAWHILSNEDYKERPT